LPYTTEQTIQILTTYYEVEVEYRRKQVMWDEDIKSYINLASKWLTGEEDKTGMLLCGNCGNGKTTMMHAIRNLINNLQARDQWNEKIYVRPIEAVDMVKIIKNERSWEDLKQVPVLAIDDLGLEPAEIMNYGNVITPAVELLSHRYNEQLMTIVTTNLDPSQIKQKYGVRIADRFREMFLKIVFKNGSYR
jgi:DNA replication protein DnaC